MPLGHAVRFLPADDVPALPCPHAACVQYFTVFDESLRLVLGRLPIVHLPVFTTESVHTGSTFRARDECFAARNTGFWWRTRRMRLPTQAKIMLNSLGYRGLLEAEITKSSHTNLRKLPLVSSRSQDVPNTLLPFGNLWSQLLRTMMPVSVSLYKQARNSSRSVRRDLLNDLCLGTSLPRGFSAHASSPAGNVRRLERRFDDPPLAEVTPIVM